MKRKVILLVGVMALAWVIAGGVALAENIDPCDENPPCYGTPEADSIFGRRDSSGSALFDDTIHALAGDDFVFADRGNDTIYAGEGIDSATGYQGTDTMHGGPGGDKLLMGSENDDKV